MQVPRPALDPGVINAVVASISEINNVLVKAKGAVSEGRFTLLGDRWKNMNALAQYGWTIADVTSAVLALTHRDYYRGPREDVDSIKGGYVWEFGCNLEGVEVYIKLKLCESTPESYVLCFSFHEPERTITYPYRS